MSAAPEASGVRRLARLSSRALDAALAEHLGTRGADAVIDLRADAYGHGAAVVERRARDHGATLFRRGLDAPVRSTGPGALSPGEGSPPEADAATEGLLVYGFSIAQQPVLALEGEVVAVKSVAPGTPVSYGYQYRTRGRSVLALVGLGYADGVPRLASNRAPVRVGETRGIVAGRIAMDQFVVDLGDVDPATAPVGSSAVLWDDAQSLAAWCEATERSAPALTAGLGRRIQRVWTQS